MNKKIGGFLTVLAILLITLFLTNVLLFAQEQRGGTITVIATVLPTRYIIVNEQLTIQKILSNTAEETRPVVLLDSLDGQELPYSESIQEQYQFIKPTLNFSEPGVIYERDERPIQALMKRIWRRINSLLSGTN